MSKKILVDLGNVRIKEYDSMNVTVERYEDVFIPKGKQTIKKWVFKGYCGTILSALEMIQRKELIIDPNALKDLSGYLKEVRKSNAALMEVVRQ